MHTENIEVHSDWHWIPPGSVGAHSHGEAGWQPCALSCTPYEPDVWSSMDKQELRASNTVLGEGCHKACTLWVSCPRQNNSHGWVVGKNWDCMCVLGEPILRGIRPILIWCLQNVLFSHSCCCGLENVWKTVFVFSSDTSLLFYRPRLWWPKARVPKLPFPPQLAMPV